MVKAFGLIGITASLLFSQGCGGKKNEVASVAPAAAPSGPSMASMDGTMGQGNASQGEGSEGSSSGGPSMSSFEGSGSSGDPSMYSGSGSGAGTETGEMYSGSSENAGNRGPNSGNSRPNNQNGFGRGPIRPPRNVPPPTLKEQSVNAFQSGNPKRAYTLMESYALVVSDEEAADVLKNYRWASQKKRPQLGLNIAVGVTVKNPAGATDLSPLGGLTLGNGNGGGFGGGGGDSGMGGGMSGAPASSGNEKGLAETTGEFGKQLVAAFKEKHESGAWSPAFSEYSLMTARAAGFGAGGFAAGGFGVGGFGAGDNGAGDNGAFGEGFSNGNGDLGSFEGGNQSGFSGGMQSGSGMGQSDNGAGSSGFQEGEMNSSGMPNSGGKGGIQLQGASPGMSAPGMSAPGMSAPGMSGPGMSGPGMGGPGMGGSGMGGSGMGGPGMDGSRMDGSGMGGSGMGGSGRGFPPAFAANAKLPAGSSPLAPCLTFIGVDETNKLMKKASQEGYDGLMLFEVTIKINPAIQKVTNDTLVRVVQPSSTPKDVKRVYVSKSINNIQFAKSKAKGEPDGLDETVEKIVRETEEGLALQSLPTALTPEVIATKRIPSLVKETETSVIDRMSEVNLYYYKGFIDEKQKADAFEQIAGQAGRVIASGSPSERLSAIEKLLEREFK